MGFKKGNTFSNRSPAAARDSCRRRLPCLNGCRMATAFMPGHLLIHTKLLKSFNLCLIARYPQYPCKQTCISSETMA
jgi:hypothetical protein